MRGGSRVSCTDAGDCSCLDRVTHVDVSGQAWNKVSDLLEGDTVNGVKEGLTHGITSCVSSLIVRDVLESSEDTSCLKYRVELDWCLL